ncbi:DUF4232 domain-containing protein [Streptomyces sp. NPDC057877]|uniref:DUF4232 domain-containing protein n=1 Tax=Streptomyces sp. NPDC057877 TaxID=3346269 RepID=UPI0036BE6C60
MTAAALPARVRTALVGAVAVPVLLLTGCGGSVGGTPDTPGAVGAPAPREPSTAHSMSVSVPPASAGVSTSDAPSARCRTPDLRASVGRNSPGAGQHNYPVILTNASSRTCTLYGYPGAAFVDAAGEQLGPDPVRVPERPTAVRLAPGQRAWAGLSFSNPRISGAETATPAALLVTPPDEHDALRVAWTAGPVPVAGNTSVVQLTMVRSGTGG